ncbi:hypothetical protein IQ268_23960 [Oculatella sp. LEGE 06141]|uniref:hypothetical protein n=1 Tax=Oculatella sp. LEGE 06141 TaxID=1828648 RepID=UPI001882AD4C|nr:hypothetical protein [Oculatella sp. LEGE 06141]MBE9181623.1 hypothetical protein [Oculatella sp. LEGE 06141]
MASINISELNPAGSGLFQDSESFLNELTDDQSMEIFGSKRKEKHGKKIIIVTNIGISISVQTVNGNTFNANTLSNVNTAIVC